LLLAEEPTTALDATVQNQVLILLRKLQKEMDMGVICVTHDLGVAAQIAVARCATPRLRPSQAARRTCAVCRRVVASRQAATMPTPSAESPPARAGNCARAVHALLHGR